ncbi:MAG: aldo/keto reductase [Planctomycetota bacterium]|nr:aldo/keto reductase [Planctomycetota bacterium]
MSAKLRWGIIGAGRIARAFASGVRHSRLCELVAVGSRAQESADAFGREFGLSRCYAGYEKLLADPDVQAVYIATPHPMHAEWAIKAAEAGKHVLCEKPISINHPFAMAIFDAAAKHGVFCMEAYMYRCHPQTARLVEMLRRKEVGDVQLIQANFAFRGKWDLAGRLLNNALGGGGILDVGGYPVSMCRLIAGAALGGEVAEPVEFKAVGYVGPESRCDEWAAACAKFPGNILAQMSTGVRMNADNTVRIYCTGGTIHLPSPWTPAREGGEAKIIVCRQGKKDPEEIVVRTEEWLYGIEADTVAGSVAAGRKQAAFPAMTWKDSLDNMKVLDEWRRQIGCVYDAETSRGMKTTISGRPINVHPDCRMKYGEIPGVGKKVSRLVMGVDNQRSFAYAAVMFDHFFENGGNCFDTAWIYGRGDSERLLGEWIRARNLRDRVVILDKGAHTPNCFPEYVTKQLKESLERLGTDYVDIYMMHRDNPQVPVGEFVDVLNEHLKAGRIRAFGGSNWTIERIEEANAYAKRKGLAGFAVVSNNFSLAEMVTPVWEGCIHSSDAKSREWFRKTQMILMPWSSQARGFFLPEISAPDRKDNPELVRCWYSEANFRRQARAIELARKKGVEPINIALAYVLCQPFPTFPLIGPRTPGETRSSLRALDIELTPAELKYLNLESDSL